MENRLASDRLNWRPYFALALDLAEYEPAVGSWTSSDMSSESSIRVVMVSNPSFDTVSCQTPAARPEKEYRPSISVVPVK